MTLLVYTPAVRDRHIHHKHHHMNKFRGHAGNTVGIPVYGMLYWQGTVQYNKRGNPWLFMVYRLRQL